jgi:hypothetical protein
MLSTVLDGNDCANNLTASFFDPLDDAQASQTSA